MKLILLDYATSSVDVCQISNDLAESLDKGEIQQEKLLDMLGYRHHSQYSWMFVDDNEIPVYYNQMEEPLCVL